MFKIGILELLQIKNNPYLRGCHVHEWTLATTLSGRVLCAPSA